MASKMCRNLDMAQMFADSQKWHSIVVPVCANEISDDVSQNSGNTNRVRKWWRELSNEENSDEAVLEKSLPL